MRMARSKGCICSAPLGVCGLGNKHPLRAPPIQTRAHHAQLNRSTACSHAHPKFARSLIASHMLNHLAFLPTFCIYRYTAVRSLVLLLLSADER